MGSLIHCAGDRLIYTAIHHNGIEISDPDITIKKISQDILDSQDQIKLIDRVDPRRLIVSFVNEGHDINHAALLLPYLQQVFLDYKISFVFSSINHGDLPVGYKCLPLSLVDHRGWFSNLLNLDINWQKILLDRKFLCLNRRPSLVRERLVWNLIQKTKPYAMRVSLGCSSDRYSGPCVWLSDTILVDGVVSDQDKCQISDHKFLSCLFNIITESSDQSDSNTWSSLFLTEKTWKPFATFQIPLWMAVPGTVETVRGLGFDVFDDICDHHRYDTVIDENTRQDRLVDLVVSLDQKYSILCCRKLRKQLWDRLQHNFDLMMHYKRKQPRVWLDTINAF